MKNKYDLSVCLAAIRKDNWERLYDSIVKSVGDYTFELIFCGPHDELPEPLRGLENVRCIQDYGCPTRAQQISRKEATGRYITWTADDGWFFQEGLKQCIHYLDTQPKDKKCVVTQYTEGGSDGLGDPNQGMYRSNSHDPVRSQFYPNHFLIFNSVVLETSVFHELGGFDCRWEHLNMNTHDLAFRAQRDGSKFHFSPNLVLTCDWNPGEGDHVPVQQAYHANDAPLFRQVYMEDQSDRIKIDYYNWMKSDPVWKRRFGDKK